MNGGSCYLPLRRRFCSTPTSGSQTRNDQNNTGVDSITTSPSATALESAARTARCLADASVSPNTCRTYAGTLRHLAT